MAARLRMALRSGCSAPRARGPGCPFRRVRHGLPRGQAKSVLREAAGRMTAEAQQGSRWRDCVPSSVGVSLARQEERARTALRVTRAQEDGLGRGALPRLYLIGFPARPPHRALRVSCPLGFYAEAAIETSDRVSAFVRQLRPGVEVACRGKQHFPVPPGRATSGTADPSGQRGAFSAPGTVLDVRVRAE
jgi:hypothetical protein